MYYFCLCSLYQKKAEEAHRILEGLGPRVELVSAHFNFYFCVFHVFEMWEHFIRGIKDARERASSYCRCKALVK